MRYKKGSALFAAGISRVLHWIMIIPAVLLEMYYAGTVTGWKGRSIIGQEPEESVEKYFLGTYYDIGEDMLTQDTDLYTQHMDALREKEKEERNDH